MSDKPKEFKGKVGVLPKPSTWRLLINEQTVVYFNGRIPRPRRRRALKRWFGWRVQIQRVNQEWIDT